MEKENTSFKYTYSAKEQEEIKKIQQKYQPQQEMDDMDKLRKLDASVNKKATMTSLVLGICGALILGAGMSLIMTDLGSTFGLEGIANMAIGIFIGIIGIVLVYLAYPIYRKVIKKEREKIAPEILRMTEELMKV